MNNSTELNDTVGQEVSADDVGSTDLAVKIISLVFGAVGTVGNGFVLVIIFRFTRMAKKLTHYFIINQCAVDLWCSVLTILTYATKSVSYSDLSSKNQNALCKFWFSTTILWASVTGSTYNLVALAFERYFKVVYPIAHKTTFNKNKALVTIVLVWVVGFVWHGVTLIPTTEIIGGACALAAVWPNVKWQRFYGFLNVTIMFFLPVGVQLFCYANIWKVLRKRTRQMDGSSTVHTDNFSRAQRNIIKTSLLLSLCFVLCWSWNQVTFFVFTCGVYVDFSGWFYNFTVIAVFFNSCINPAIYILQYDEFRAGMRKAYFGHKVDPMSVSAPGTSNTTYSSNNSSLRTGHRREGLDETKHVERV